MLKIIRVYSCCSQTVCTFQCVSKDLDVCGSYAGCCNGANCTQCVEEGGEGEHIEVRGSVDQTVIVHRTAPSKVL